jgi:polysaccharide biosynthesis transport protein
MRDLLIVEPATRPAGIGTDPDAVPAARRAAATSPSGGTPEANVPSEPDIHLSDYVRVLYKRRWPVLTVWFVVLAATCVYTFTTTPIYGARVQILIEKEASNVVSFKQAVEQNQVTDDYYQTQYRLLQSRALARRTLDALQLWHHPQFAAGASTSRGIRGLLTGVLSKSPSSGNQPEPPSPDETKAEAKAIDTFLSQLTVSPIRNSRLVDVIFESPDPTLAANVANGVARAYIEENLEFKFLSSKEASDWLAARLGEQRDRVEKSEQALQKYREATSDAVSLEERQNIVVQKLADLNSAVTRAKTERVEKEAAYNQIRAVQNNFAALDNFPAVLSNTFIQQQKAELADLQRQQAQMSEKLGANHPEMVKIGLAIRTAENKIHAEMSKIVQAVYNDYQRSIAQENSLKGLLDQQKREALDLNRRGIEYGVLSRDAMSNRQIFDSLLQRTKETSISGELKTSNIRVVDAAEPPRRPLRPSITTNLAFGASAGLMLAIGLAFFFEYVDNRVKSPEEMTKYLGLPYLGMIPALFDDSVVPLISDRNLNPTFSESFRTLRTNVAFSSADEGLRSVMVTSTMPNEGKTVVATNLATALAQTGMRVLLIDADMRKGRVNAVFDRPRTPGLSDFLVGRAKISQSVRTTNTPGLWVMPAGTSPPNPSELLGSNRFADFVTSLGQHFDWAIFDTPPIMPVTDSGVVAHMMTGVVFVVGADMTNRYAAQRAVEQLARNKARFLGAVLNRADLKHHSYYYSRYYRREYSEYYDSNDRPTKRAASNG